MFLHGEDITSITNTVQMQKKFTAPGRASRPLCIKNKRHGMAVKFYMLYALLSYSSLSCFAAEPLYASDCGAKVIATVDIDK